MTDRLPKFQVQVDGWGSAHCKLLFFVEKSPLRIRSMPLFSLYKRMCLDYHWCQVTKTTHQELKRGVSVHLNERKLGN